MVSKTQSDFLNLCRWFAATLVVIEHSRNLMFVDYGSLESPGVFHKAFYFATGFGHESVVVFFVISGFLVGGKSLSLWREQRFAWKRYLADRFSRIYPVLIAALILGGILDWVGSTWVNDFGFYDQTSVEKIAVVSESYHDNLNTGHFVGNVLMLQNIHIGTFGSNGPLWSLAHEWWYYLLFPLALGVLKGPKPTRALCAALIVMLCWLLTRYVLILFGVWLVGVLAWWCNNRKWLPWWVALAIMGAALLGMRLEIALFPFAHQFMLGIGFAVLLNSLAESTWRFPLRSFSRWLADFSYSLYLVHFPVILLIVSIWFAKTGMKSRLHFNGESLILFASGVFATFACSYWVSLFTELKTPAIRILLYRHLGIATSQ